MNDPDDAMIGVTIHFPDGERHDIPKPRVHAMGRIPGGVLFITEKMPDGTFWQHVGVPHSIHFKEEATVGDDEEEDEISSVWPGAGKGTS